MFVGGVSVNKIKEARQKAGLSQKYVAMTLGVAPPSVSNWESGKTQPTPENLKALAALYNVSIDYLLGNEPPAVQPVTIQTGLLNQTIDLSKELEKHAPRKIHKYVVKGSYGSGKSNLIHGHLHALTRGAYSSEIDATRQILVAKLMGLSDDNLAKLSQYADLLRIQEDMERDAKK
jgi:transcriptional regulator with XRE-family HTH domain